MRVVEDDDIRSQPVARGRSKRIGALCRGVLLLLLLLDSVDAVADRNGYSTTTGSRYRISARSTTDKAFQNRLGVSVFERELP
jgi:hypothetical protein